MSGDASVAGDGRTDDPEPAVAANDGAESVATTTAPDHPAIWRNRPFVRLLCGLFVTNVGDSLYSVAVLWLVLELSGSTALTGLASAMLLLSFPLQAVAGPVVDRLSAGTALVVSQAVQGVVVLVLPLAAFTGTLSVELVLATIPVLSLASLVVSPARAAVVPQLVAEEQLSRGNSLLATVTLGLDMVFDAVGGVLVALFGATLLFLVDSVTFGVAAVSFAGLVAVTDGETATSEVGERRDASDGAPDEDGPRDGSVLGEFLDDLRAGVGVLRGTLYVEIVAVSAVSNFAVGVTLAVLPAFGKLLGGPAVYGLLLGALGVGRLVGSAVAPALTGVSYGRLRAGTCLGSAALWIGSVYAPTVALTVVAFGVAWVSAGVDGVLMIKRLTS